MKPGTAAVLALLRERGDRGLTPLDALDAVGSFRLGARIWELKADGYAIDTELVTTVGGKRTGDSALCAAYALANVPTRSEVSLACRPSRESRDATSTPVQGGRERVRGACLPAAAAAQAACRQQAKRAARSSGRHPRAAGLEGLHVPMG